MKHFSIVVPTCNRPESLKRLLSALADLEYPAERFEVIVVDDGGRFPLGPIIQDCRERLNTVLLRQPMTGPAGARNFGAANAGGRNLAFIDDDCRPASGWLQALERVLDESQSAVCGGRVMNGLIGNPYSAASQFLMDYLYEHYSPLTTPGAFFTTNNLAVARSEFLEMGAFDPELRFGEDRDFCYRWAMRGGRFRFVPEAVVWHFNDLRLSSFIRLHFQYGGGTASFRSRARIKHLDRVRINPPSWYLKLILSGVRTRRDLSGVVLSLLLASSQAANTAGFLWQRLSDLAARASSRTGGSALE
ncbi:MAG: glycosyl transferase [Acidobacteria bacterium]|nr:glycosyl transferase [Acidobacteriota bacterium]